MSFAKVISAAILGAVALAQTQEQREQYPTFTTMFDKYGVTWEPVMVKTEDGWNLNVLHPTGDANGPWTFTKSSVVFVHGMGGDASEFLSTLPMSGKKPMAIQLGEMGYDVWLVNNRATAYSNQHDFLENTSKEFWSIDWRDYGSKDFPAVVAEVRKRNGDKKVSYVGHSQGTTQAFAGLGIIPEWYDANVSTCVMLGPCTEPNETYMTGYTKASWDFMDANGIYASSTTYGPSWEESKAKIMADGPPELQLMVGGLEHLKNVPLQAMAAYAQGSHMSRFQHYTPDFFDLENPKMPLIDFGLIKKTKVAMFVGAWDNTCPLTVAQKIFKQLGGDKNVSEWVVSPLQGHVPWGFLNSEWYMEKLTSAIDANADV